MHELYIAQSIISTVKKSLPDGIECSMVRSIYVDCGQLDAVIPETLSFLFDAIKSEYQMTESELCIRVIPVLCKCGDCLREFSIELPVFICPDCRGGNIQVLQGRGIRLTKIEAADQ
jgi:hydrogenase nickel incorporation protein HypA/HybF